MSVEIMSLEEMKNYQGTNPRPDDFDEYWERGLALVSDKNPNSELIPADFQVKGAKCYNLFFNGVDGARIHAKYLCPTNIDKPVPVIFLFHGYTANCGDWSDKLAWVQQGFAVAAMDCRGQAGLSQDIGNVSGTTYLGHIIRGLLDSPEQLLYRQIFLDTAMLVKVVRQFSEIDDNRMTAHGGSQGGALALVCAALTTDIKRVSVQYPFLCDYQRIWELDCSGSAYEELKHFFRSHDPRHKREKEFFTKLGYIDVQNLTPRIKADVLWAVGLKDLACPASSQFAAYNHMVTNKKMLLYPDYGHEYFPDYFDESVKFLTFSDSGEDESK